MNKEVLNIDGKIIVETDKGTKKEVICSSNLEEILSKENDLEILNNKIGDLYSEIDSLKKKVTHEKKSDKKTKMGLLIANIIMPALAYGIYKYSNQSIDVSATSCILFTSLSTLSVSVWINYMGKTEIKKMDDELESKEVLKEELNNEFVKEKSKLRKLKKASNYSIESEIKSTKLDENKDLKEILNFYNHIIHNYNELKDAFDNGELRDKLKDYDEEKINIAYKYFKDNCTMEYDKRYEESKKLIKTKK